MTSFWIPIKAGGTMTGGQDVAGHPPGHIGQHPIQMEPILLVPAPAGLHTTPTEPAVPTASQLTPYEQYQHQSVLDSVSSGLSVDAATTLCVPPKGPMPGFKVCLGEQEARADEINQYRPTNSQAFFFDARAQQSRAIWLSVAARCEPHMKRFRSMLLCGSSLMLEHSASTSQYRISSPSCGNRFCPRCGRIIAKERIRKVQALISATPQIGLKFITISPAHVNEPLHAQLNHLRASFRRLRQQKIWRDAYLHGCCVIEVKIGRDGLWHAHLHIIADGHYVPHRDLLDACRVAFARECSVDVRRVRNAAKAVDYVSKYIAKSCNDEKYLSANKPMADELYTAMYRAKTCWAWGKTAPKAAKKEAKRLPASDWQSIIPFNQLLLALRCGNREITDMLIAANAPIKSMLKFISRKDE